ncbi:hypothetical protein GCM10012283_15630 [Phycicoccus endophyticus]|nr:hypothetical protein GCM10012283_15630 [Phycicoccus endophyticus]
MEARWAADCRAALPEADATLVASAGADLARRWREPHRHYHGVTHLGEVLAAVDRLARAEHLGPEGRDAARLAAWFHDAVYSVTDPEGNERASADLAGHVLTGLGAEDVLVGRVGTLVLDTARHELPADPPDPARPVLHDADLWVLAAPVARFDAYCAQVRAEYAHLAAPVYAAGRTRVLRPLLARRHVFRTPYARGRWEPAARENLARELTRLAG